MEKDLTARQIVLTLLGLAALAATTFGFLALAHRDASSPPLPAWVIPAVGLAVFLVLCSGAGGYCSVQRGRPVEEGLIFGLILGPIGVIVAACLPEIPRPGDGPH